MADWEDLYCDALPDLIRPSRWDDRFLVAATAAQANGWLPKQIAAVVAARNYGGASSPSLLAIMRLEDHGSRKPRALAVVRRNASGCDVCPPGRTCPDPVSHEHRIPETWVRERVSLLLELARTPGMTQDERGAAMAALINVQKRRANPV